jgi:hypothetical protein
MMILAITSRASRLVRRVALQRAGDCQPLRQRRAENVLKYQRGDRNVQDRIFQAYLARQYEEGMALAASSDLIELYPLNGPGSDRFIAVFRCRGLVIDDQKEVKEADHFEVGIWFPADYLRRADPFQVLTWFGPLNVFHPNISNFAQGICVGRLAPGTALVDILYQCFEIITWNKVTMREDDALNMEACDWARRNPSRFPVDRRSLKRRALDLEIESYSND